jgi:serine/threonine protein kinase
LRREPEPGPAASPPADDRSPLDVGPGVVVAGRYRLGGSIAFGSHAEVFAARDLEAGREVAIKFIPSNGDSIAAERLRREAAVLATARSRNAVEVCELVTDASGAYLILQRIHGPPVGDILRTGPRTLATATDLIVQILDGLAVVHARGLVHRRIAPEHVLVDSGRRAVLCGFGEACERSADSGSVWFDLVAVAMLLIHMVTGKVPAGPVDRMLGSLPGRLADVLRDVLRDPPPAHLATARGLRIAIELAVRSTGSPRRKPRRVTPPVLPREADPMLARGSQVVPATGAPDDFDDEEPTARTDQ